MLCGSIRHRHRVHPYSTRCRSFVCLVTRSPGADRHNGATVQRWDREIGKTENPYNGTTEIAENRYNGATETTEQRKNRLTETVNKVNLLFASTTTHQGGISFAKSTQQRANNVMGATDFVTMYGNASKQTVGEAFAETQRQARHEYGHNGYTGTIAEVTYYKQFPADCDIDQIIDDPRSGVDRDTCGYFIDPDNGAYVFFGIARE